MKHLLIILISILLLGCVKNQGTEFLYLYESSSGVVLNSVGDGKVQPKYKGEITNGKPNGFGVMTFPDGKKYVGKFKDGERNGQGTFILPNGDKYVGKFKDGKFMVKEHSLSLMETTSMLVNGRIIYNMVKEHSLSLVETSM